MQARANACVIPSLENSLLGNLRSDRFYPSEVKDAVFSLLCLDPMTVIWPSVAVQGEEAYVIRLAWRMRGLLPSFSYEPSRRGGLTADMKASPDLLH